MFNEGRPGDGNWLNHVSLVFFFICVAMPHIYVNVAWIFQFRTTLQSESVSFYQNTQTWSTCFFKECKDQLLFLPSFLQIVQLFSFSPHLCVKSILYRCFHITKSKGFTNNCNRERNYFASGSCVESNILLRSAVIMGRLVLTRACRVVSQSGNG